MFRANRGRARPAAALLACCLAACGGGGGGGSSGSSGGASYNLQTSYAAFWNSPHTVSFTVSGDCTGTASESTVAPVAASFEGASATAIGETLIRSLSTGCAVPSQQVARTRYVNASDWQLGFDTQGGSYGVAVVPMALPAITVSPSGVLTVGAGGVGTVTTTSGASATASGPMGIENLWADNTKLTSTGALVQSFSFSLQGVFVVTQQVLDANAAVTETRTETYQLSANNVMSLVSVDEVHQGTTPTHLVFTAH